MERFRNEPAVLKSQESSPHEHKWNVHYVEYISHHDSSQVCAYKNEWMNPATYHATPVTPRLLDIGIQFTWKYYLLPT